MTIITRRRVLQASILGAVGSLPIKVALASSGSSAQDALTLMSQDPEFSNWIEVLQFSGLEQYAQGGENFTAFVPTNAVFKEYPEVLSDVLRARTRAFPETTVQVQFVRSHVILDLHPLSEFSGKKRTLTSIAGNPIFIDGTKPGSYTVRWQSISDRYATAFFSDNPITASNALIYAFDSVSFS